MTDRNKYHRLPEDPCIRNEVFFDYIDGKLSNTDMHKVETHLLDCAMCSDALEGLIQVKNRDKAAAAWNTTTGNPSTTGETIGKVISIWKKPSLYYSAAACLALLIGFITLKNFVSGDKAPKTAELDQRAMDSVYVSPGALPDSMLKRAKPDAPKDKLADTRNANSANRFEAESSGNNRNGEGTASVSEMNTQQLDNSVVDVPKQSEDQQRQSTDDLKTASNSERDADILIAQQTESSNQPNNKGKNKPNKKDASKDEAPAANTQQPRANSSASGASTSNNDVANDIVLSNTVTNNENPNVNASNSEAQTFDYNSVSDSTSSTGPYALKESDKDIELSYNKGVELLGQNKAEQSLVFFDEVLKFPKDIHFEDAQWKKAEALILLGRKTEARELLNKIVTAGGKYKTQAAERLKTL